MLTENYFDILTTASNLSPEDINNPFRQHDGVLTDHEARITANDADITALQPALPRLSTIDPTASDTGFAEGKVWVNQSKHRIWRLSKIDSGPVARWVFLGGVLRCVLTNSADITVAANTPKLMTYDTEDDTDNLYNPVAPSRVTVPIAGKYAVIINFPYDSTINNGVRDIRLYVNGTTSIDLWRRINAPSAGYGIVSFYDELDLAAGDYLQSYAFQTNSGGSSLAVKSFGGDSPKFTVRLLEAVT